MQKWQFPLFTDPLRNSLPFYNLFSLTVVIDTRSLVTHPGGAKKPEWGHRAKGKYPFYHKVWKPLKPRTFRVLEQKSFTESTKRNARSNSNEGTGTKTLATFAARILDE